MIVTHKAALSLFISVFLFAGFTVIAFTGFFDLIESRFYKPSVTGALTREIEQDTQTIEEFFDEYGDRFSATLWEEAVQRSFLPHQNAEDIFERSKLYGLLVESGGGLQWVRFVDAGGRRLHYSSLNSDILRQDRASVAYRNYDTVDQFPFDELAVLEHESPKITLDDARNRIIFSFPFFDAQNVYRGTALFTVSARTLAERLIDSGRLKAGEDIALIGQPAGIVVHLPPSGQDALIPLIASHWGQAGGGLAVLELADAAPASLALISLQTARGFLIGRLVNESLLAFSRSMKFILLMAFFCTAYLLVFLLFNLRQDPLTIVRARIQQLRALLLDEYERRKDEADWETRGRELDHRLSEVRAELTCDIHVKGRMKTEVDALIDRSWDELTAVIRTRAGPPPASLPINEARLRDMVLRIIQDAGAVFSPVSPGAPDQLAAFAADMGVDTAASASQIPLELLEAIDSYEEDVMEEVMELEELETAEADGLEELDVLEEADASGSAPEAGDDEIEELEEVEEMEEAEDLEELEEIAEIDTIEELEELEEIAEPAEAGRRISSSRSHGSASWIEFSPVFEVLEAEPAEEEPLHTLEIVSPFTSMLSKLNDPKAETPDKRIIEQRGGVNYVNETILHPPPAAETSLDPQFKSLIDSVLTKEGR